MMRHGLAISDRSAEAPAREGVRGWCPSLHRPMMSGDGLLSRVKPSAATLTADQLRSVARAAEQFGNGQIELTRRGNVQARGLMEASVEPFADAIVSAGLAQSDPAAEAARTVLAAPLSSNDDPSCAFDAHALAKDLEERIAKESALHGLPAKFGIAVCGGGKVPIAERGFVATADITLSPGSDGMIALRLTGGEGAASVSFDEIGRATIHMMRVALHHFAAGGSRMKGLVARCGEAALFAEAGLSRVEKLNPPKTPTVEPGAIGISNTHAAILAAVPFGRMTSEHADAAAGLAESHGDGTIRITTWKALLFPGIETGSVSEALRSLAHAGFITDASDSRLRIAACTGAPGCSRGESRTLDDAAILADQLLDDVSLHISGCGKGCARSGASDITLVARTDGYDMIRKGGVGDAPVLTGLSLAAVGRAISKDAQ